MRLHIFIRLSTYIVHHQVNILGTTLSEILVLRNKVKFSEESLLSCFFKKVTKTLKYHIPPLPLLSFYQSPTNHPIIIIEMLRTRSKPGWEAELCSSIFSPVRLSESSHCFLGKGSSLWFTPLLPQHFFPWTMASVLDFAIIHHYHHLSKSFYLRTLISADKMTSTQEY